MKQRLTQLEAREWGFEMSILVKETEAGSFEVVKGGEVFSGSRNSVKTYFVRSGDKVSAVEISEWIANGVAVENRKGKQ